MFARKIFQVYQVGGIPGVTAKVKEKYGRYRGMLTISWVRFSIVRKLVESRLKTLNPPILILSLPRSGSSWVGDTLGNARSALYLREPVTETYQTEGGASTVIEFNPLNPPKYYKSAADNAFSGIPAFPETIAKKPGQWSIFHRKHRRIVIKEVNPLALGWYLKNYQPRVIFLVRHPAAVALSYWKLGWRTRDVSDREEFFISHGHFQGRVLKSARQTLKSYDDYKIVLYEDACDQPISIFQELYDFAGFGWDKQVEEYIIHHTTAGNSSIHWTIDRDSKSMIRAWESQITKNELYYLRNAFGEYDLPWYRSIEDW